MFQHVVWYKNRLKFTSHSSNYHLKKYINITSKKLAEKSLTVFFKTTIDNMTPPGPFMVPKNPLEIVLYT